MSRSTRNATLIFGGILILAVGGPYVYQSARAFLRTDPMAQYRTSPTPQTNDEAMVMTHATLKAYDGTQLINQAEVDRMTLSSDRNAVRATGVKKGQTFQDGKPQFRYEADLLNWNDVARTLQLEGGIRAFNNDMDLKTTQVTYEQRTGKFKTEKAIQGRLYGGQVKTAGLEMNLNTKKFSMREVVWTGKVQAPEAQGQPRKWSIKGASVSGEFGVSEIYTLAQATDGEIVVKADKVVRDVKTDMLTAVGNVRYFSTDVNLLCERVTVYRTDRKAVLAGKITMFIKPDQERKLEVVPLQPMRPIVPEEISATRPKSDERDNTVHDAGNRRQYPVTITASNIVYFYKKGERRAQITGAPQARQDLGAGKWRHGWAYSAEYNGETESLKLNSAQGTPVRLRTSLGDDIRFKSVILSTREGDNKWSGEAPEGDVFPDDDSEIPRPGSGEGVQGPIGQA